MIGFVDKERIVDILWTFDIVSHSILVAKLVRYGLDKWISNCVENLCYWLKGFVIYLWPATSQVPQELILLNTLINDLGDKTAWTLSKLEDDTKFKDRRM